jgi:hypothetical protein
MTLLTWIGIAFCVTQSAMFSGLNLAFFSISRLRLEMEASQSNQSARKILALRSDSNFLLTTILWGNVGVNVLLTLLSNSVLAGVSAFIFSTVVITFLGEVVPQAYFSRHALRMASLLSPVLRVYQILLYPVAKSTALILDRWLGPEAVQFYPEKDLKEIIKMHMDAEHTDIEPVEGRGAMNFLSMDDQRIMDQGEILHPESVIELPFDSNRPVFPEGGTPEMEALMKSVHASGKKWIVVIDAAGEPGVVIDADGFLRSAVFDAKRFKPYHYCHRPILFRDPEAPLGQAVMQLKVHAEHSQDHVIDQDIVLHWGAEQRIITGSDILGKLLRGIAQRENVHYRVLPT